MRRATLKLRHISMAMKTSTFLPSPLTEILRALIPKVGEDEADECVEDILYRSLPVPVSPEIAILAGKFKYKGFKGGTADAIILATAHLGNHKIVTGDLHFKGLPDVLFVKSN